MKRIVIAILAAVLAAGAQTKDEADRLLKAARNAELVDGNLNAAIKQYGAIVSKYVKSDRGVAAMALVRMAECYQKMGDAESRKIFEQVVREYADQKEAVTEARAHLDGATRPGHQTNTLAYSKPGYLDGTVSADGRYLAYELDGDLAVREIATAAERRITNRAKGTRDHVDNVAISRDSKQVAYTWHSDNNQHYELRLASLAGDASSRRLYDCPDGTEIEPYGWSPDGKSIVVETHAKENPSQLGLLSVPGGSLRVLKSLGPHSAEAVFLSPDGKYLGYDRAVGDSKDLRDIFLLSVDSGSEAAEPAHGGRDTMMGWSPDGARLLFSRQLPSSTGLWAQPISDGKFQGAPELIRADIGPADSMGITRSGALYYTVYRNVNGYDFWRVQLASVDFETGRFVSSPSDVDKTENSLAPSWSPDGKFLAYTSIRTGSSSDRSIVIRSAETGEVVRVLRIKLTGFEGVRWAPDGRSFIVGAFDPARRARGVYQIDGQSGDASSLFLSQPGEGIMYPAWSPDGKSVYFMRTRDGSKGQAIVRRDLTSGKEQEIIRGDLMGVVNLSPDGRFLAAPCVNPSTNSRSMLLVPTTGGEAREVMNVAVDDPSQLANVQEMLRKGPAIIGVLWAPDSRSFLTLKRLTDEKENDEVWRVPVNGDAPRKLDLRMDRRIAPVMSLNPDGRRLAYTINEAGAWQGPVTELWVLENFLAANSAK